MAIREFSPEATPRAKIAFLGGLPQPGDLDWFKKRNFECEPCTPEDLRRAEYAVQLDAVIWTQNPGKLNALPRELGIIVPKLLDHDVRVYVRLATDETLTDTPRKLVVNALLESRIPAANLQPSEWRATPEVCRERENSFLLPCVYIIEPASSWADIAVLVCDRPAGPAPNFELKVDERFLRDRFGPDEHGERVMLLKRAFWDCSELQLTSLDGGLSGAPAFKAYASLGPGFGLVQRGATGAYPHLYFVKIGPRKKIVDEYDKYCGRIFEYVPFHLAPRLRRDRCNLASTQGILVGDFVEGAESLITCARGARCGHAVSNLFDKTLGGWRKQKRLDMNRPLSRYLEKRWHTEGSDTLIALPPRRAELVRELGGDTDLVPLKKIFENHGNTSPLIAPAHGDMHAMNVLVRHGDAILIDFEKLEQDYPLTYDPASLEGGLLVEGFVEDLGKDRFKPKKLIQLIEPLYELSALRVGGTTLCRPGDPTEWYFDAVNQIRTLSWATENEPSQYALTLALCLIRKGCNIHENLEAILPSTSRAIAFFFGQKILRDIAATTGEAAGEVITQSKVTK
jgi:hypothetical protein